ncbi:MAG: hypothetical protein R3C59_21845 [Planctomycetaceae bacterium]
MKLKQATGEKHYVVSRLTGVVLGVVCLISTGCQHNRAQTNCGKNCRQVAPSRIAEQPADEVPTVELPAAEWTGSNGVEKAAREFSGADISPGLSTNGDFDASPFLIPPVTDLSNVFADTATDNGAVEQGDAKDETKNHRPKASSPPLAATTAREAAQALETLGAKIDRDFDGVVQRIDLAYLKITDEQAKLLRLMTDVTELDLTGTDISDATLTLISELSMLRCLKLKGTRVSDVGVRHLAKLTQLGILDLGRTEITDAAMSQLRGLTELHFLVLNHTQVSDKAIADLKSLQSLRGINLIDSRMTPNGIAQLEKDLPRCLVVFETDDEVSFLHLPAEFSLAASGPNRSSGPDSDIRLRRLQQLAHQDPEIASHLASVYAEKGEWLKAAAILDVATKCRPHDERLQYRLAESLAYAGQTEEAYLLFRKFLSESAANLAVGVIVYDTALNVSESYLERSVAADSDNARARRHLEEIQSRKTANHVDPAKKDSISTARLPTIIPRKHPGATAEMN